MTLVDTSVWVRAMNGREPFGSRLARLLERDAVAGHELVYGELLMGDRGGRPKLLADYELIEKAPVIPYHEVVEFVCKRRLHGLGIGWIDVCLLASAMAAGIEFWTVDAALAAVACQLGLSGE